MGFLKIINDIRHTVMTSITRGIGASKHQPKFQDGEIPKIEKILIIRPNHKLGNQLLLTPLVQYLETIFPHSQIDIFAKGTVANIVFKNYSSVKKIYQLPRKPFSHLLKYAWCWVSIKGKRYDLVINGDKNSSSGRLLTKFSRGRFKIFGDVPEEVQTRYSDYTHISKYPIYNTRWFLSQIGHKAYAQNIPTLSIKLRETDIQNGKKILQGLMKNDKKTICIYTNATGNKCYSESWWEALYQELLKAYGEQYNIIEMLPVENISRINFKAPHFYSKNIHEMGGVMANTSIFITADNGVMHLASASETPVLGFFKTTDLDIYAPYGNKSIALDTKETSMEDWMGEIKRILSK
ncbi:glycosyltransferase family 9 protein [Hyunsoonleella rubra]|uniref:Glycosyltransferase family 9 protein n=1 Tax=Hyunsoonleella rubra TaxID=1737062 RepID=A0ABW5TA51_9FLAO